MKAFAIILIVSILIIGAVMLYAVKNSSYLPTQKSSNQGSAGQNIDLNQQSQGLDASDQDLNSMDSSFNQIDADSSSF